MTSKGPVAATASQTRASTGLTLTATVCLFAPLVIFLALLGWATWENRSVKPMAFDLLAGLMAAVLLLGIVGAWPAVSRQLRSATAINAKRLDPFQNWPRLGDHLGTSIGRRYLDRSLTM